MEHPHIPIGRIVIWRSPAELALYMDFDATQPASARMTLALRLRDQVMRERPIAQRQLHARPAAPAFRCVANGARGVLAVRSPRNASRLDTAATFGAWLRGAVSCLREPDSAVRECPCRCQRSAFDALDDSCRPCRSLHLSGRALRTRGTSAQPGESGDPGDERDALDRRRLRLNWRLTTLDLESAVQSARILGRELGRLGLGRAQALIEPSMSWPVAGGGFHHMGTTRMHRDPAQGVTDSNCQVHGVKNLYVAGSSLFPTERPRESDVDACCARAATGRSHRGNDLNRKQAADDTTLPSDRARCPRDCCRVVARVATGWRSQLLRATRSGSSAGDVRI